MSRFQVFSFLASTISLIALSTVANGQTRLQDKDMVSAHLQHSGEKVLHLFQIADCDQSGAVYHDAAVAITAQGPVLSFWGTDLTGNSWNAKLPITGLGCVVFKSDIDNNGQPDLVIYSPGITDRGSYGTSLTILLFDETGKPFPWQATGRFTLVDGGIQEIRQDSKGVAIIQTSELGLAAWGGISFASYLYRFSDGRATTSQETFEGIEFPHLIAANENDSRITQTVRSIDLSTNVVRGATSPVQSTDAKASRHNKLTYLFQPRHECVVPFAMKIGSFEIQCSQLLVADQRSCWIAG